MVLKVIQLICLPASRREVSYVALCYDVLKNPHQCKNGHAFCLTCISASLESYRDCPSCKAALKVKWWAVRNSILWDIINGIQVKWDSSGPLEEHEAHYKSCSMREIDCPSNSLSLCPHPNCTGKLKRHDIVKHLNSSSEMATANITLQ